MSGEENPDGVPLTDDANATKEEVSDTPAAPAPENMEEEPETLTVEVKPDAKEEEDGEVADMKESTGEENPAVEEEKPKAEENSPPKEEEQAVPCVKTAEEVTPPREEAKPKEEETPSKEEDNALKVEEKAKEEENPPMEVERPNEEETPAETEDATEKTEEPATTDKPDEDAGEKAGDKAEANDEEPQVEKIQAEKGEINEEVKAPDIASLEKRDEEMKEEVVAETNDEDKTEEVPKVDSPRNDIPKPDAPVAEAVKDVEMTSSIGDDDTSKADDQSVGDAPNTTEEGNRTDDAMDTEDQNTNRTDPMEEQSTSSKADLPYSTRGRSAGGNEPSSSGEWERSAIDTLEEIGRVKESTAPPPLGASFLESLGEEERRTRTRFVPEVDGMHVLRKAEIKDDLALARSLVSASGVTSLKKSKAKKPKGDEDTMEVDEEEGASPSEDDRSSDIAGATSVIEFRARDFVLPSGAFNAPNGTKGDDAEEYGRSKGSLQSPSVLESVTAFNPPRPPESIGAKKKHRMLRWERRPEDVEVDLNNYRKTVQRTRQELHSAESEFNRLETIDAHLRWHYLSHLNLMNQEYLRLNDEFSSVQQECVKAADLFSSRTRSRGSGKGSYVMRDVLTVLKTRGSEAKDKDAMNVDASRVSLEASGDTGVGGLAPLAFSDWNRSTTIEPRPPASSWLVAGENVKTPYGDGVVLRVNPAMGYTSGGQSADEEKSPDSGSSKADDPSKESEGKKDDAKSNTKHETSEKQNSVSPARATVKLKFGTGHFKLDAVSPSDNPAVLSDVKLASRWKSIVDSALSVEGCIDLQGMDSLFHKPSKEKSQSESSDVEDGQKIGADDSPDDTEMAGTTDTTTLGPGGKQHEDRFLPFGSSMLPTSSGRGNSLQDLSITDVEEGTNKALFDGKGVLGKVRKSSSWSQLPFFSVLISRVSV